MFSLDKGKLLSSQVKKLKSNFPNQFHDLCFNLGNVPKTFNQLFLLREGVIEFLEVVKDYWNLFVNTKGRIEYGQAIVDTFDPTNKFGLKNHMKATTVEDITKEREKDKK